jgi:hypothetical protein
VNRRFLILCLAVSAAGICFLSVVFGGRLAAHREFAWQAELARQDAVRIREQVLLFV